MTNDQLDELERLAKAAIADNDNPCIFAATQLLADFNEAANPAAVLELIPATRKGELYDHMKAVAEANGFDSLTQAIAEAYKARQQAASGNDKLAGYEAAEQRSAPIPPSNAGRAEDLRRTTLDWIRDDAPLSLKMTMTPELVRKLVDRLQALSRSNSPEDAR